MKTISLMTADGRPIARNVRVADKFTDRAIGLLRTERIGSDDGLLLIPAASVHTFGMRYAIDVVFLDRRMRVLNVSPRVQPRRVCIGPSGAARVLELAAGRISDVVLLIGTYVLVADEMEAPPPARPMSATASVTRPPMQFSLRLPPRSLGAVGPASAGRSLHPSRSDFKSDPQVQERQRAMFVRHKDAGGAPLDETSQLKLSSFPSPRR